MILASRILVEREQGEYLSEATIFCKPGLSEIQDDIGWQKCQKGKWIVGKNAQD